MCGAGEGDCDSDSHCRGQLKCGTNNCPPQWSTGSDCCYDPSFGQQASTGWKTTTIRMGALDGGVLEAQEAVKAECAARVYPQGALCFAISDWNADAKTATCRWSVTGCKALQRSTSLDPSKANPMDAFKNKLVNKGGNGCTASRKCATCAGDCDRDDDCQLGLKCWQRSSSESIVPGCVAGGRGDVGSHDYCYDPDALSELAETNKANLPPTCLNTGLGTEGTIAGYSFKGMEVHFGPGAVLDGKLTTFWHQARSLSLSVSG